MADSVSRRGSTFSVAREVVNWVQEIDPGMTIEEDDVMPLCVGPMRKVLAFSMDNFRNSGKVAHTVRKLEEANDNAKVADRRRINHEKNLIRARILDSLKKQKEKQASLDALLEDLRIAETEKNRLIHDRDTLETRDRITKELDSKRDREIKLWVQTSKDLKDNSIYQNAQASITELKSQSLDALRSSYNNSIKQHAILHSNMSTSDQGHLKSSFQGDHPFRKQTHADLHSSIIADYLLAARLSNSAAEKGRGKAIDGENDTFFQNALAIELAAAEKFALKKCISEVETTLQGLSLALSELENQKLILKSLKERTSDLRKNMALQAYTNISLDKQLDLLTSLNFGRESVDDHNTSDSADLSEIKVSSSSAILHARPFPEASEQILGDRLDSSVEHLGLTLSGLSGCWVGQTDALSSSSIHTLRRIVPHTSSVTYSSSNSRGDNYLPTGRFSLADALEGADGTSFQLPMPLEDFTSRQASDSMSTFRVLSSRLCVPAALSAPSALKTASIMKSLQRGSVNKGIKDEDVGNSSQFSKSISWPDKSFCATFSDSPGNDGAVFQAVEAVGLLAGSVDTLHRALGHSTGSGEDTRVQCQGYGSAERVEDLVASLHSAADRLSQCFSTAQILRRSLLSLDAEEMMTRAALSDFITQPAFTL